MDYSDLTIVLPTFNEAGTIGKLIDYITHRYKSASIIVVDDGSSDGTKEIVIAKAKANKKVKLLDRASMRLQRGLTASVIDGIFASKTRFALVMDADLQHPPEKIKEIKEKLDNGYGLVVATRVEEKGWSVYRKLISKSLIKIGYLVLYLRRKETCGDIFSGFFGVDVKLFKQVLSGNRKRFVMEGYKVLFDFLKCLGKGKVKVANVPYEFQIRKFGKSKAGFKQGFALFKSFLS